MGILALRAGLSRLAGLSCLAVVFSLAAVSLVAVGCDTKSNKSKISSSLFLAPFLDKSSGGDNGITQHSDRLDTLQAIRPDQLPADLQNTPTEPFVLGRLSARDPVSGKVESTDNLLYYEAQSRSILSVNICPDPSAVTCGRVRLHYSSRGLDEVQNETGVISTAVTPIRLQNGWIMTFDSSSRNLLAFREEEPRRYVDDEGAPQPLPYRSADQPNGTVDTESRNFGAGNGVVASIVVSGEDMVEQLSPSGVRAEPIISKIFEIEPNKVIVIFGTGTIRAIHLLELFEQEIPTSFDLDDTGNPEKTRPVHILRGTFRLFPESPGSLSREPFLDFETIAERITGNDNILLEAFQPVGIPDGSEPDALIYDTVSSIFLRVGIAHGSGEITGSILGVAISDDVFINILQGGGAGDLVNPPFLPSDGFNNPDKKRTEIIFSEESSNNVLAYDYKAPLASNLRIFVPASNFSQRRTPGGGVAGVPPTEPVLNFARGNVTANRLAFDQGLDQLLSISYTSSVVVIVADNAAIAEATGNPLAELSFIGPLDDEMDDEDSIRAFDTVSNSLLEIRLDYGAFPVSFK